MKEILELLLQDAYVLLAEYDFRIIDSLCGSMGQGSITLDNGKIVISFSNDRSGLVEIGVISSKEYKQQHHFYEWGVIKEYLLGESPNYNQKSFPEALGKELNEFIQMLPDVTALFTSKNRKATYGKLDQLFKMILKRFRDNRDYADNPFFKLKNK